MAKWINPTRVGKTSGLFRIYNMVVFLHLYSLAITYIAHLYKGGFHAKPNQKKLEHQKNVV